MPRYKFWVRGGRLSDGSIVEVALDDAEAAWAEATAICADLSRDIISKLKTEPEWLLEATDEAGHALFKLRFVAESLEPSVEADVSSPPIGADQLH